MTATAAKAEIGHNSASVGEVLAESPEVLFREKDMLPALFESIEKEIADLKADADTDKGRKAMRSLAYSIAQRKTRYDEAGKALNEDLRKQINTVDAVRKTMRDQMDVLRDKAKAPAEAWDKKEDDRKGLVTEVRTVFMKAMQLTSDATIREIDTLASEVEALLVPQEVFLDLYDQARAEQQAALEHLAGVKVRVEQAVADRLELERLRAEKEEAERAAREAEAKAAAEKAEKERIAAAEKRAAEAAVEAERQKAQEAARAAEEARLAEQAKRDAEAAEERRKAQAAIDEANRKAREAEEALARQRREDEAKAAAAEKAKAEQARLDAERQRNQEHRQRLMKAAKEAIMEHGGVKEGAARQIVLAIVGGSIPHVSMEF